MKLLETILEIETHITYYLKL